MCVLGRDRRLQGTAGVDAQPLMSQQESGDGLGLPSEPLHLHIDPSKSIELSGSHGHSDGAEERPSAQEPGEAGEKLPCLSSGIAAELVTHSCWQGGEGRVVHGLCIVCIS